MSQNINYYFDGDRVYADSCPARPEAVAPPDNALWVAPPDGCPADYAIVAKADQSGWEIVADYRGAGAYDQQGQWQRVERPGPLPEGWTAEPPAAPFTPGPDYIERDDGWWKIRFSKKDFLLLCGVPQVIRLEAVITSGNAMAKAVHTLLMAADYIDVTDPATAEMVNLLATEAAGSILTAQQAASILQGVPYEEPDDAA